MTLLTARDYHRTHPTDWIVPAAPAYNPHGPGQ